MSIFSRVIASFKDRRRGNVSVSNERRGGMGQKINAANHRLNCALDELNQTLTMSRAEFASMLAQDAHQESEKVRLILDSPWNHVEFVSFSEKCEFLYKAETSLGKLCRHPKHSAYSTGMASCSRALCPFGKT